ncbi:beta-1,3-glucanase family protein [Marinitenerispora sediminis]|uniref:Glycosyl hydrolase n=1 Tax=Marinitenerispora sediminis TaxID=1931232 RepID=A0A368T167_9ACTN|nr:beta-1,3-glucanase family protein [Marinitenerispora sediminis]RCV47377.1 glycosyl hydrolase [Marinitenerispora sediminis]RCV47458.1 glycosyl hydrolase [Marinitenerispora sediminis]RCV47973.1 glycosyl hydrolase [Marinitenerispora sediminis]
MISRRSLLGSASVAALGIPLLGSAGCAAPGGAALASAQASAGALPLTVVNRSGRFPDSAVRLYIVGTNLATGEQSYVTRDGVLTAVRESDNVDGGYTDYAIPLSEAADLTLPFMSGRIYVALEDKLRFRVVAGGDGRPALQYPAGWVSSDPNYNVLHDTVEFTHNESGMFCNTTMVDQFSVPLAIELNGERDQTTGTLVDGGRAAIFDAIAADPVFSSLIVADGRRVIAPGHGLDAGLFPADYYAPYIDQAWSRYTGTDLRVTTNAGTFTGRVDGSGRLAFDGGVAPIAKPSTRDVLFCDGALAAPNDGVTGPVAAILGAAFNRSTLVESSAQPTTDPATFYRAEVTNTYAKVFHDHTVDGRAYGFAFDDVAEFASYIQDHAPASFTVTLTPY